MVNLSEVFRSLFGPPQERLGPGRHNQQDFENLYGNSPGSLSYQQPPTFHEEWTVFGDESHDGFSSGEGDFLQEFEQMFHTFFGEFPIGFNLPMQVPPMLGPPPDMSSDLPGETDPHGSGQSLQDRMLRQPDTMPGMDTLEDQVDNQDETFSFLSPPSVFGNLWRIPFGGLGRPEERIDRDFDNEVESGTQSLDDILAQKDQGHSPPCVPHRSSSSSFSSVTIIGSNGVTEHRTTKRDSSGNEEVTVTRRIGDQTHTITRQKDDSGTEHTQEDLMNIDHDKLNEFDDKWRASKTRGQSPAFLGDDVPSRQLSPFSSIYDAILDQFFPKRR